MTAESGGEPARTFNDDELAELFGIAPMPELRRRGRDASNTGLVAGSTILDRMRGADWGGLPLDVSEGGESD